MVIVFEAAHTRLPSIVSSVVPIGVPYRVAGTADGVEWTVAQGIGVGTTVAVSDAAAPFDIVTTYTVEAGEVESALFLREFPGPSTTDTVISSEDGRHRIAVLWEGDAAMSWEPGSVFAQPIASRRPVQVRPLVPGGPSWALECRVDLDDVEDARRVFEAGRVWISHSRARVDVGSSLPRVMAGGIAGGVSEGRWPLGRTYSATLRELEHGTTGVPVVTWGEARAAGIVWGPSTSFESIREAIAGA